MTWMLGWGAAFELFGGKPGIDRDGLYCMKERLTFVELYSRKLVEIWSHQGDQLLLCTFVLFAPQGFYRLHIKHFWCTLHNAS